VELGPNQEIVEDGDGGYLIIETDWSATHGEDYDDHEPVSLAPPGGRPFWNINTDKIPEASLGDWGIDIPALINMILKSMKPTKLYDRNTNKPVDFGQGLARLPYFEQELPIVVWGGNPRAIDRTWRLTLMRPQKKGKLYPFFFLAPWNVNPYSFDLGRFMKEGGFFTWIGNVAGGLVNAVGNVFNSIFG